LPGYVILLLICAVLFVLLEVVHEVIGNTSTADITVNRGTKTTSLHTVAVWKLMPIDTLHYCKSWELKMLVQSAWNPSSC